VGKFIDPEDYECDAVQRQQFAAARVITSALLSAGNSRNSRLVIEKTDSFFVLTLVIFHDKP